MGSLGEADTRIVLTTVAMVIAGGAMLVMIGQGDGSIWAVIGAVCSLIVGAIGVFQLVSRHLWT